VLESPVKQEWLVYTGFGLALILLGFAYAHHGLFAR
jgi:hypothetical protein